MEDKKSFYTEATKKAAYDYKAGKVIGMTEDGKPIRDSNGGKIKRVPLDMQKSDYDTLKQFATDHGEAVNQFIKIAIKERMERMTAAVNVSD